MVCLRNTCINTLHKGDNDNDDDDDNNNKAAVAQFQLVQEFSLKTEPGRICRCAKIKGYNTNFRVVD